MTTNDNKMLTSTVIVATKRFVWMALALGGFLLTAGSYAQPMSGPTNASGGGGGFRRMMEDSTNIVKLGSIRLRDVCILPDQASKTYYMVGPGFRTVRAFTSKDLVNWQGPKTLPTDMMTLDGTLWVEDGVPYMVFCHEWVQIKDGTVEYVRLKDDLSATDGEPKRLFNGSDAVWSKKSDQYGCHVTDGPYLYTSKSGKLFMIWTSGGYTGYTTGIAISDSGKLAGPWKQQAEPVYGKDGGHAMLFTTFDGKLMMVLHSPKGPAAQPRIFEMEDTGETLRIAREFTSENPNGHARTFNQVLSVI